MEISTASSNTLRASEFVNSLGVNTHLPYTDGRYANAATVIADLQYLGVDHVRDWVINDIRYPGDEGQLSYPALAQAGVKFDFNIISGTNIPHALAQLEAFQAKFPGSITALEGPNEVNNWPVIYNGTAGDAGAVAFQNALYAAVKADPALSSIPVYQMTSWPTLIGGADVANVHLYPGGGAQPLQEVVSAVQNFQGWMPGKPLTITEAGYHTLPGQGGVDGLAQAKLSLNLLFDAANNGVAQTYLYELLDAYADPTGSASEKHYGLFDIDNQPKPLATALHNLTGVLRDTGADADTFAPQAPVATISGLTSLDHTLTLVKSSGAADFVVWSEPDIWDAASHQAIAASPHTLSLALDKVYADVAVYDPLAGASPVATYHDVASVQIKVIDHPLVVEVGPHAATAPSGGGVQTPPGTAGTTGTVGGSGGTGALSVKVSADNAQADGAQFQILVDGHAVGGVQSTHAAHSLSQWDTVTVSGEFDGSSAHQVSVQFLNDSNANGLDRNLYVGGVSLGDHTVAGEHFTSNTGAFGMDGWDPTAAVMAGDGVASYSLGGGGTAPSAGSGGSEGPAPSGGGVQTPPGTTGTTGAVGGSGGTGALSVKVSADNAQADGAQFQILVDGHAVGGVQSTHAAHSLSQWDTVTVSGEFDGSSAHQVSVQFLNDSNANGLDRNLYVGGVSLGDHTVAGEHFTSNTGAFGMDGFDLHAGVLAGNGTASYDIW